MATKNEVAKADSFSTQIETALVEVKGALPTELNITRFAQNASVALNNNPQLVKFAKDNSTGMSQIKNNLVRAAIDGLDISQQEVYLIPYGSQLQYMPSFKGAKKMAISHSVRPIKDIYAKVVREGDEFSDEIVDGEPRINFKPVPFNSKPIIGAFAVCIYKDGSMIYEVMTKEEIDKCRNSSKAKNSTPWNTWYSQMAQKCVLHRLCKNITIDWDSPEQRDGFMAGIELETNPVEQAKNDVSNNANTEEFDDADVVEVNEDGEVI